MNKSLILFFVLGLLSFDAFGEDKPTLTMIYYHYPPQMRSENGVYVGRYIEDFTRIAAKANMKLEWFPSNFEEEANMLNSGRRKICSTGRMPTKERAQRWTFLPYLFDTIAGDIVLTTKDKLAAMLSHKNITEVVLDRSLVGALLKSGIYGTQIDVHLLSSPSWVIRTASSDQQLMNMVIAGRAHYTVVPKNRWIEAKARNPEMAKLVVIPNFGAHPDYPVYVACSRAYAPEVIKALSAAMGDLAFPAGKIPQ